MSQITIPLTKLKETNLLKSNNSSLLEDTSKITTTKEKEKQLEKRILPLQIHSNKKAKLELQNGI